jgi:hypothetical protein
MDRIFPPHHEHEFVSARTCRCTGALGVERKDDQILRIEMLAGGETGGEWMSASLTDTPNSVIAMGVEFGRIEWTSTSASDLESMSDELLIAGK